MQLARGLISVGIIALASHLACRHVAAFIDEMKRHEYELGQMCKRISSFKHISQMEELIRTLALVIEEQPKLQFAVPSDSIYAFKLFTHDPMEPCLQQASAIQDLAKIISQKENVCSSEQLDMIESYYDLYIKGSPITCNSTTTRLLMRVTCGNSKLITAKFFELYANQVSFTCKANLLASLKRVDALQLVSHNDYTRALPWLTHASMKLCNKIEQQEKLAADLDFNQQELFLQNPTVYSKERILQCKAIRALSEISTVHELVEASVREEQSNDFLSKQLFQNKTITEEAVTGSPEEVQTESKSGLFLIVPQDQRDAVRNIRVGCSKLRPIYEQTVQPIVRLIRMGFNPNFANFDKVCSENKLIQKWFSITLVCSSMLSSHLTDIDKYEELKEDFEAKKKSLVVIDEDSHEEDITPTATSQAVLKLIKSPIEDELWVYKYGTAKIQRFKEGMLKKVFKLLKVEDIDDHIVLRRNVAAVNGWIVKVVILTVSLLTLR